MECELALEGKFLAQPVVLYHNLTMCLAIKAEAQHKEELADARDALRLAKDRVNSSKRTSKYSSE